MYKGETTNWHNAGWVSLAVAIVNNEYKYLISQLKICNRIERKKVKRKLTKKDEEKLSSARCKAKDSIKYFLNGEHEWLCDVAGDVIVDNAFHKAGVTQQEVAEWNL